jgi:hypothetical protein
MKRLNQIYLLLFLATVITTSCKNQSKKVVDIPIKGFETQFTDIVIDTQKDSVYTLDNTTSIYIQKGSILDSLGNVITEPITIKFRQFDDASAIYMSGLPMEYNAGSENMVLQTAGMFEIRAKYKGSLVKIDSRKPIRVDIGSLYNNNRQGFFKLDDKTGEWSLVDIPESRENTELAEIKEKITKLKPRWEIPLSQNYCVFSLGQMADVFLGDNYHKLYDDKFYKVVTSKMKKYGVKELGIAGDMNNVTYKGNLYPVGEMLWKANKRIVIPKWVGKLNYAYYDDNTKKYIRQIEFKKINYNTYMLIAKDMAKNKVWNLKLTLITHLRYLVRYTPEQIIAKNKEIEQEIVELETKIKNLRMVYYTVNIYSMGIFNCDNPTRYRSSPDKLMFSINGKSIEEKDINKVTTFNKDLSSYLNSTEDMPIKLPFFLGENKIIVILKNGDIGMFSGAEFNKLNIGDTDSIPNMDLDLTKINPKTPEELKKMLSL